MINKSWLTEVSHDFGFMCLFRRWGFRLAIDHVFAKEKFQNEITNHGDSKDDKILSACLFCQVAKVCGKRGERQVKAKDLHHGNRYIGGRLKGEAAVEGKVP